MTIVLADVANILGLPITGEPIIFEESFSAETAIMEYLGVEAPKLYGKSLVTYTWLRYNFMHIDRIGDEEISVDEDRVIACTRAYLLGLINAVLFPDSSDKVNLRFLPFLKDLTEPTLHAWGASMLAFLYSSMSDFVHFHSKDKLMKNLNGCVTLIQVWSYEHFSIGRPLSRISCDAHVFPIALRWTTDAVDPAHCVYSAAPIYRGQFDSLQITEVQMVQYCSNPYPPEIQQTSYELSLHRFYIIYHGDIMYHPADRVMRQFGMKQHIPEDPPCYNRGRGSATARARKLINGWNSRLETHNVSHLSQRIVNMEDVFGDIAYRSWWGAPIISNRFYIYQEPRFQQRAVDDYNIRGFREHIIKTDVPALEQAYDNPNPEILKRAVKNFLDWVKAEPDPPNPPLHIPPDYPVGIISQRQPQPRKVRPHVIPPYIPDDEILPHQDEGTSQWTGHWNSQWIGEGTSYSACQGTSYSAGQGTSQCAGERTSQLAGEGPSQCAGEGTSQWPGVTDWFESYGMDGNYYTQLLTTPSAPVPTQHEDTQEEGGDAPPENTVQRRSRLNLREVDRPDYWQLDRQGR